MSGGEKEKGGRGANCNFPWTMKEGGRKRILQSRGGEKEGCPQKTDINLPDSLLEGKKGGKKRSATLEITTLNRAFSQEYLSVLGREKEKKGEERRGTPNESPREGKKKRGKKDRSSITCIQGKKKRG